MTEAPARSRRGRPRDPGRDAVILAAALDVLAETGFERMTMDRVAARARAGKATLYRRWPSKSDLVMDAVAQVGGAPTLDDLPNTGSLRGDLVALLRPQSPEEDEQILALVRGISSLLSADGDLAPAASTALVETLVAPQRLLMQRAVVRGEIAADVDIETLALITPSITAFRLIVQRKPVDVDHLVHLVDTVLMPAIRAASSS